MKKILSFACLILTTAVFAQVPPSTRDDGMGYDSPYYGGDIAVEVPERTRGRDFIVYGTGGKWGIKTGSDSIVVPLEYDKISSSSTAYILQKDGKFGLMSLKAQMLLPVKYDSIVIHYFNNKTVKVKKDNKWGVFDTEGNKVLPIKYHEIIYSNVGSGIALLKKSESDPVTLYLNGKKYGKNFQQVSIYKNACIISAGGKHGVMAGAKEIIPFEYDSIYSGTKSSSPVNRKKTPVNYTVNNGTVNSFMLLKDGKYGVADVAGKIVLEPEYDEVRYDNLRKLYRVRKDKKYGVYFEASGFKTDVDYDRISTDGAQYVTLIKDNKWGIIDYSGNVILPTEYDKATIMGFNEGFNITKDGKSGIADNKGNITIPPIYDEIRTFAFKHDNLYIVTQNNKTGVIDKQNNSVIPVEYDRLFDREDYIIVKQNDKYGVYSADGVIVASPQYDWVSGSETQNSKLLFPRKDDLYGIIGENNTIVYPPRFTDIGYLHDEEMLINPFNVGKSYRVLKDTNGKSGLLEEFSAQTTVPIMYDDIHQKFETSKEVYFIAEKNKKYGVITGTNTVIIPFGYDFISFKHTYYSEHISGTQAVASQKGKYGVINLQNDVLVPFQYQYIEKLSSKDLYKAKKNGAYMLINSNNTVLNKGPFDEIAQFEGNEALTFYKGQMRIINTQGEFVTQPVSMKPHNGFETFDEMKLALIEAMNSKDEKLLKEFAAKAAPSAHIMYFFKENIFTQKPLSVTEPEYIREKYYQDLYRFKMREWNSGHYNKSSLTDVKDFTLYSRKHSIVTNKRTTDWAFGDTRFMEKIMRNAIRVNGYWISTYFMTRSFSNSY